MVERKIKSADLNKNNQPNVNLKNEILNEYI